jgi:hypothetical protein
MCIPSRDLLYTCSIFVSQDHSLFAAVGLSVICHLTTSGIALISKKKRPRFCFAPAAISQPCHARHAAR